MSIAAQCPDCCSCPSPTVVYRPTIQVECTSLTGTGYLCGWSGYDDGSYDSGSPEDWEGNKPVPRKWLRRTFGGQLEFWNNYGSPAPGACGTAPTCHGLSSAQVYQTTTPTGYVLRDCDGVEETTAQSVFCVQRSSLGLDPCGFDCVTTSPIDSLSDIFGVAAVTDESKTLTVKTWSGVGCVVLGEPPGNGMEYRADGDLTETLSDEDTLYQALQREGATAGTSCCAVSQAIELTSPESTDSPSITGTAVAVAVDLTGGVPSTLYVLRVRTRIFETLYPDAWTFEESTREVTTDEAGEAAFTLLIDQPPEGYTRCFLEVVTDEYNIAFPAPGVGSGTCYRAEWVERTVPTEGVALTSLDVVYPGVCRPSVTVVAGSDGSTSYGSGARLVAIMSSAGAVSDLRILNPGSGYSSDYPPAVVFEAATNGGTTPTGWSLDVDQFGRIVGVNTGSGGDYLPTAEAFGGSAAPTISLSMSADGGISSAALSTAGAGFIAPEIRVTLKISEPIDPDELAKIMPRICAHYGTETERCAVWPGVVPGGYNPGVPATWPVISETDYELAPGPEEFAFVDCIKTLCDCEPCTE